jgi:hypothetical protein
LVTRDEIQKLMSGYATGSLTENERKQLFEAALEDQDLFDQLAHEQALKELIDQPGARDRLIAALAPAGPSTAIGAWKKPLAWGLAAMFVVSMSVAALMLTRSGIRTQVAQKQIAETPSAQTPIPQTESAPLSQPSAPPVIPAPGSAAPSVSGSPAPPPIKQAHDRRSTTGDRGRGEMDAAVRARGIAPAPRKPQTADKKKVAAGKLASPPAPREANSGAGSSSGSLDAVRIAAASPPTAPSPSPPPPAPSQATPPVQSVGQISQPPGAQPQGFVAGQPQGVPQPAPTPQAAQLTTGQVSNPQTQGRQDSTGPVQNARNPATQTGPNQVQSAAGGGGRGGAGGGGGGAGVGGAAIAGRAARLTSAPPRFAFDYSIDGEDLVFKFSADGYFSLHIAPGGLTIVDSRVTAGSTRRERITANGTEAVIVFSASPQSDAQGVSIETRARSLTVEDPARKRIDVLVKFY